MDRRPVRGRRIALIGALALSAGVAAVGVAGAVTGPPAPPAPAPVRVTATPSPSTPGGCAAGSGRRLAVTVFTWDTAAEDRQDVVRRIAARADSTGRETPGLLADLDGYLPDSQSWEQLAVYQTRQTLTSVALSTPATWSDLDHSTRARLGAGTTAFTVHGTRTRSGLLAPRTPVSSSDRVVFTMFVRCTPPSSGYRLLRLSQLGHPLP